MMRVFYGDDNVVGDIVTADYAINNVITAGWAVNEYRLIHPTIVALN